MRRICASFFITFVLAGCASERSDRAWPQGGPPHAIELQDEQSIATVHFPRGLYSLADEDASGYYYRSAREVIKHAFAGFQPYDGGIFVSKKGDRLRGYIVWAGGRTQLGDLSRARYRFRE